MIQNSAHKSLVDKWHQKDVSKLMDMNMSDKKYIVITQNVCPNYNFDLKSG